MIDLGLNQYKIQEIKYEVKEGKTVIFKLHNFNLEDVEIIEKARTAFDGNLIDKQYADNELDGLDSEIEDNSEAKSDEKEEFNLKKFMSETKAKELHDYEPFSCLKNENGMQETLDVSREKKWKDDVRKNPSKPTPTGNALIKIDNNSDAPSKPNETKLAQKATIGEIRAFNVKQKLYDSKIDTEYRDKIEKKLAKGLIRSKTLIDEYLSKMPKSEKDAFASRIKENYFNEEDKYDEFSKILSLNGHLNSPDLNENEKKTLDASRKKEWEEDIKNHDINPDNYKMVSLDEKYKDTTKEEKAEASREIIKKMAKEDSEIIKNRNEDRTKEYYFHGDPNDEYSKIKSFSDVNTGKTEFVEFLEDKPYVVKDL